MQKNLGIVCAGGESEVDASHGGCSGCFESFTFLRVFFLVFLLYRVCEVCSKEGCAMWSISSKKPLHLSALREIKPISGQ